MSGWDNVGPIITPEYFDGDGAFRIKWTTPTNIAYEDEYIVYRAPPGSNYTMVGTAYGLDYTFSNLEQGIHRFAVQCICYKSEDYEPPVNLFATLQVEVGIAGEIIPDYKVISILYAPPGRQDGRSNSSVTYSGSSTLGSTTSSSDSLLKATT